MEEKIRIAVIGNGGRGHGHATFLAGMSDVAVTAVCDKYEDRAQRTAKACSDIQGTNVLAYTDYRRLLADKVVDAAVVATDWNMHVRVAVDCMKAGVRPAIECGGACSVDECWELVRTYEKTGVPCMYLENCCYERNEMTLLRMIKKGMFGELVHVQGGYEHDLREEVSMGHVNRHYRYDNYHYRCAELYPAHALGPMSRYTGINRGNRMLSLVSMASKPRGLHEYIVAKQGPDAPDAKVDFRQGDIVNTLIRCANGETMLLTHDTTLPRPYSRAGRVQGTKGIWMEDKNACYLEGISEKFDEWESFDRYLGDREYEHPLWTEFREKGIEGGSHGGMDYLVLRAFIESVRLGAEPPIDTYDAASLLAVTALSEESIATGSAPVAVPDFTDGKWINRGPDRASKFSLDAVHTELFD